MATIKFETGQSVNFQGNPTQADIEEVAKSLGINQAPTQSPKTTSTPSIFNANFSPSEIGKELGNASDKVGGVVNSVFPGKQTGQAIGTLAGLGIEKIKGLFGGKDNSANYDTTAPSPLQVGGDVAKGAAMVGGLKAPVPTSIFGTVAQGAGYGALAGGGQAATQTSGNLIPNSSDLTKVIKGTTAGGLTGGVVSGATSLLGHIVQQAGDKIQMTSIKPSMADIKDGFSLDTIKEYNLGGSLSTVYNKTESTMNDLTKQLNEKLAGSDSSVDLNQVFKDTEASLGGGNKLKSFGSNGMVGNALEQLKGEIVNLGNSDKLPIPDAQLVKQAAGRFGAWQYGSVDPASTARETVYNAFYNNLKTAIENNSPPGVAGINKALSKLIPVMNAVIRRIPVAERNNAISLPDMINLTASLFNPHALVGLGISLAQKEGSVGNLLSKLGPAFAKYATPAAVGAGTAAGSLSSNNAGQQQ